MSKRSSLQTTHDAKGSDVTEFACDLQRIASRWHECIYRGNDLWKEYRQCVENLPSQDFPDLDESFTLQSSMSEIHMKLQQTVASMTSIKETFTQVIEKLQQAIESLAQSVGMEMTLEREVPGYEGLTSIDVVLSAQSLVDAWATECQLCKRIVETLPSILVSQQISGMNNMNCRLIRLIDDRFSCIPAVQINKF
eukprot:TRINITY_DN4283_c0_g1_i6.p1 TRINITY_DN4283_c0_g1~~TRINITY_DN4283_c0_g1_i6.p1  ORF type:complete len:195 (-),score=39.34 TRINITY_DN4283_c0_g1_i6:320-904(-)